ncbi:MAG: alpha/beta fold hydrolase [Planctomycetota bacterium]|nr:alpha/beta fold hydrolase [Planctomycetota bacterium]
MPDYEIFELGNAVLQSGATIRNAKLAYKTFGTLSAGKDNVIVYPTWYSSQHQDNQWLIGEGMALDPGRYFIIVPNMLGNGLSSSPSNTPEPYNRSRFPRVTIYDQVRLQHKLVSERFGIEKIKLVTGWSMGAAQAFQWGASYPEMVERILPFQGAARCSRHNFVFLEGVKAALTADSAYEEGWYERAPQRGLRAMARVYAGWGFSQTFYRKNLHISMGYSSLEDFLVAFWEGFFLPKDANNLLALLWTWQNADISGDPKYGGDFDAALGSISAKAIVMPASSDLYFPPEDSQYEVERMPSAELRVCPTDWGHFAGGPGTSPEDIKFLNAALEELLAR